MGGTVNVRRTAGHVAQDVIAQGIAAAMIGLSSAGLVFLFGTTDLGRILDSAVAVPAWLILAAALVIFGAGIVLPLTRRKSSVVRGRLGATEENLALLRERLKVDPNARVIRSTRFGRWPSTEKLDARKAFREELDMAVLNEHSDVRRIWNVKTTADVQRLKEILEKYKGESRHSIRAFFDLPAFLPELLVVDRRGASISFPSTGSPYDLDWMIRFNRSDLVHVVRDYFDVLWDRAERMLDAGEVTPHCMSRLDQTEQRLRHAAAPNNPSLAVGDAPS
jgi:hypothetical protein